MFSFRSASTTWRCHVMLPVLHRTSAVAHRSIRRPLLPFYAYRVHTVYYGIPSLIFPRPLLLIGLSADLYIVFCMYWYLMYCYYFTCYVPCRPPWLAGLTADLSVPYIDICLDINHLYVAFVWYQPVSIQACIHVPTLSFINTPLIPYIPASISTFLSCCRYFFNISLIYYLVICLIDLIIPLI